MKIERILIALAALGCLVLTVAAAPAATHETQRRALAADFTHAAVAEVRDAQGQVVLRGEFAVVRDEDDDEDDERDDDDRDDDAEENERSAKLAAQGSETDAVGEVEVEVSGSKQEIEFSVRNLQPGAAFTLLIDGVEVGTARASRRGRVEFDTTVPLPTRR